MFYNDNFMGNIIFISQIQFNHRKNHEICHGISTFLPILRVTRLSIIYILLL